MITNENDFLGAIIKCSDKNHEFYVTKLMEETGMTDMECIPFLDSLSRKNIILFIAIGIYRVNPIAYEIYENPSDKIKKSAFNFSVKFLERFVTYILGIVSGIIIAVVAAYVINHFGW